MSEDQPEALAEGEFIRVHPFSPFIRGGLIVVGFLGYLLSQQFDRLAAMLTGGAGDGEAAFSFIQFGVVGVAVIGAILLTGVTWLFTRYRLGPHTLEMRKGVLFRQHRQVPYDRVQSVDLVRPLLARLTGLAEVRVESAGGGESHVAIAYLSLSEAERVRAQLVELADRASVSTGVSAGADDGASHDAVAVQGSPRAGSPAAIERQILSVPPGRILASVVLSWPTIAGVIVGTAALVLTLLDLGIVIGGLIPFALITVGQSLLGLTRWYGLTLHQRGDNLTSARGLTDTRTSTIPLHRVQAVEVKQPWLWRRAGWWSLSVNIAGAQVGSASADDSESVLVPAATLPEVLHLLEVVTADTESTQEVRSLIEGTPAGFVGQPPQARRLHPLAHHRIGYLLGQRAVITRHGRATRGLRVAPYGRIQSQTVSQGFWATRLRLASVDFISTVGPVRPQVSHLAQRDAEDLQAVISRLASKARGRAGGPVGCDPAPDTVDWPR